MNAAHTAWAGGAERGAGTPRIYVHDLPPHLNTETVERHPSQALDFWFVEHLLHQNVVASGAVLARDPADADYFLIPFYPACYLAAFAYERNIDLAQWSRWERYRSELHVHLGFRETMRIVSSHPAWRRTGGRRHLFVFGQGRGANAGYFWQRYGRLVRHATFLGVEARPFGNPRAFRDGQDLVIPAYTPWSDVIAEVTEIPMPRDILIHFRGRPWGAVRREVFRHLRPAADILLDDQVRFALGGENRRAVRAEALTYFEELHRSVFCLCPAGWTPWSKRIYETILCGAIPVLIPGTFVPPYGDQLDARRFSVTVSMEELPHLERILREIPAARIAAMQVELARVRRHFLWHQRPEPGDAFAMLCDGLARRGPSRASGDPPPT